MSVQGYTYSQVASRRGYHLWPPVFSLVEIIDTLMANSVLSLRRSQSTLFKSTCLKIKIKNNNISEVDNVTLSALKIVRKLLDMELNVPPWNMACGMDPRFSVRNRCS